MQQRDEQLCPKAGVTLTCAATDVSIKTVLHLLPARLWVTLEVAACSHSATYVRTVRVHSVQQIVLQS